MPVTEGLTFDPLPLEKAFRVWGRGYKSLANLVGCTTMTCRNCIFGKHPTSKYMVRIAGVLGVDMRDCWKITPKDEKNAP